MTRQFVTRRLGRGLGALAVLAALTPAACSSVDNVLDVTDPDIISPENVSSAAGANALRIGALSRFNGATSGNNGGSTGESLWLYTGLFADEFRSGDTFAQRDQTDQRAITYENVNIENGYTFAHRARVSAIQALDALRRFAPDAPPAQLAEMYFVEAYTENELAEAFCSGVPFSSVVEGVEQNGVQVTSTDAYERSLAHADSGLALLTGSSAADVRIRNALSVVRARALLNLGRFADAAAAVATVPTSFAYVNEQSQTTRDNGVWSMNVSARRYVVADGEGPNGIDFATAGDPRLPICIGGDDPCRAVGVETNKPFDSQLSITMYVQLKYPTRESPATVADGVEARLIEAEAQLRAGNSGGALATLNALRAGVAGLPPLADAGSADARVNQLFRERAFWLFGTGHRLGDLRRLVRQYGRSPESVYPVGPYFKGGEYGTQLSFPIPQAEENNPNVGNKGNGNAICLDLNA